jgi:DNA-binding NarL/FixJ family response regulator
MFASKDEDMEIVGEAGSAFEFFELLKRTTADLVLLDILLPDVSGIDIARQLRRKYPMIKILVLSSEEDKKMLELLVDIGIDGFISKDSPFNELVAAIEAISEGGHYFGRDIARLMYCVRVSKPSVSNSIFTHREEEIITLCAQGLTAKEISAKLNISMKTVITHKYNIFKKLGINSCVELVSYVLKNNIVHI